MLFVGTSIIHPSTEGVFLLCNILDLLIYRALYKKYQDTVKTEDELLKREIDYADEITYNAKIIVQKYKCFKNAWYVDFIGLVGIAVLILAA